MDGKVIEAEYYASRNVVEYTAELENGKLVGGVLSDKIQGPNTVITSEAMEQMADQLVGTSIEVDMEQLEAGEVKGYSVGLK